jgi:hypothetical protein
MIISRWVMIISRWVMIISRWVMIISRFNVKLYLYEIIHLLLYPLM